MTSNLKYIIVLMLIAIATSMCKKKEEIIPSPETSATKEEIAQKKFVSIDTLSEVSINELKLFAGAYGGDLLNDKIRYSVKRYVVTYLTEYQQKTIKASGVLYLPKGITTPASLISAQHGTTFNKSDAPSVSQSFTGMEFLAATGYVTLMPDYIGYGASSEIDHPYYDSHHSAMAVIDMIKAVKEYTEQSKIVNLNNKLFLAGYSEGGYVTIAAQKQLEEKNNTGLHLKAVAAGAGGYDLTEMLKSLSNSNYYSYPAYLAFVINSYNTVYNWNKPFNYFFNESYANKLDSMMKGNKDGWAINNQLSTNMDSLFNKEFYQNLKGNGELQFKKALIQNSLSNWAPKTPTKLYHGTNDEIVPLKNSEVTFEKYKEYGSNAVEYIPIPGGTHGNTLLPMIKSFFPWFEKIDKE